MEKFTNKRKDYLTPAVQAERVAIEGSICAGSDVKKIKAEQPNVEVDEWDEIGNEISFD